MPRFTASPTSFSSNCAPAHALAPLLSNSRNRPPRRMVALPVWRARTGVGLRAAEASPPMPLRGGVGVLMVGEREASATAVPSRDQMGDEIARDRFESLAQRYLRDLRRSAFVDMRV